MIIAMALVCPVHAQWWQGGTVRLPDPVSFVNQIELGDLKVATAWLDAGLPPDFMGSRIGSGLMIAAWEGNIEMMRLFLSRGGSIELRNANGETALALAAWRGHTAAVKWLVERGARLNASGKHWSPLHYAVFGGHEATTDYLLAQGADIEARTPNGSSVLMMAVYEGHEALVRKLVDRGARRDVRNDWGDGAMEWAMRNNQLGIARLVGDPEEFKVAASKPRESWGQPQASLPMTAELAAMLEARKALIERGMSTEVLDRRIASERVQLLRERLDRNLPQRAATLEVSARRASPSEQSVRVIPGGTPANASDKQFKVPPPSYFGKPKMPPPPAVRNY